MSKECGCVSETAMGCLKSGCSSLCECDCHFTTSAMTPKHTEVESAEKFWEHLFEKVGWADVQVVEYIKARDKAVRAEERERCARIAQPTMAEILLMAGEMTAGEHRTVTAVLGWIASKIRCGGIQ